jgi:hypothetical protein
MQDKKRNSQPVEESIPDSLQAEEWITPYVFVYKGQLWEIKADGKVCLLEPGSQLKVHSE